MWCLVLCCVLDLLDARPTGYLDVADSTSSLSVASSAQFWILLCLVTFSSIIFLLVGCLCCNRRKTTSPQFREFRNSTHSLNQIGFVNPLSTSPEVSIFPPPGVDGDGAHHSIISFEPLPTLVPPQHHNVKRPPAYSEELVKQLATQSWFDDAGCQFPRNQLHYVKEIGRGWFGKVVEGEARGLDAGPSRVFVRLLREDASQAEKLFFLHEATPYRTLRHSNILRVLAACTETDPYLLVFESCARGDLKEFLLSNETSKEVLLEQGIPMKMAVDVATGLSHMIDNNFIHTDVAARNCLVTSELRVKIGDTGSSIDKYPRDYYVNGEVALPIRWCAPESLVCSDTSIQTCPVTEKCNVWSFGVLLWEIFEFGQLPYSQLTDDQVITWVFGSEALRLAVPALANSHVYSIMQQCWKREVSMAGALSLLTQILSGELRGDSDEFNRKWGAYKPNHREDTLGYTPNRTLSDDRDSGLGSEQRKSVDSVLNLQDEVSKSCPSVAKSPSLENFTGSLENLTDHSWMVMSSDSQLRGDTFTSNPQPSANKTPVDFQLGPVSSSLLKSSTSYVDNEADSLSFPYNLRSNQTSLLDTDTEDELWRKRLERCEFSEKVKEKSKSVADLMVLTHIDASSGSSESSLEFPTRGRNLARRDSDKRHLTRRDSDRKYLVRRASSDSNILDRISNEEPVKRFSVVADNFVSLPYRGEGTVPGHFLDQRASERNQFDVAVKPKCENVVRTKRSGVLSSPSQIKTVVESVKGEIEKVVEKVELINLEPKLAKIKSLKSLVETVNSIEIEPNVEFIEQPKKSTDDLRENDAGIADIPKTDKSFSLITAVNEVDIENINKSVFKNSFSTTSNNTYINIVPVANEMCMPTQKANSEENSTDSTFIKNGVPMIVISESEPLMSSDEEMWDIIALPPVNFSRKVRIVNFASSSENEESDEELERIDENLDQFIMNPLDGLENLNQLILNPSDNSTDRKDKIVDKALDKEMDNTSDAFISKSSNKLCINKKESFILKTSAEELDKTADQFILKPSGCATEDGTSSVIIGCCDSFSLDFARPLKTASEHNLLDNKEKSFAFDLEEKFLYSKQEESPFSFENKVEEKNFSLLDIETKLSEDDRSSRTTDDERSYKTDDDSRSYKTEDERNQSDCKSLVTPDEDHSCDSGFREKGSLSDNDLSDNNDEMTLDPQNRLLEGEEYNLNDIEDGLFQDLLTSGTKTGWYLHEPPCTSDETVMNKDTLYVEDCESSSDEEEWWRDDRKFLLNSDVTEALRKELVDKLPASSSSAKTEEVEPETEVLDTRTLYVAYPKSLSPILEESETEYEIDDDEGSLVLNLVPFSKRGSDSGSEEDDILIVDTQSNEAILFSPPGRSGSISPDSLSSSPSQSHSHYTLSLSVSEPASLLSYDEKSQDVPTLPNFEIYDLSPNSLTLQDESSTDQFDTPKLSAASQLKSQSCSSETLYNVNFDENASPQHQMRSPQTSKEVHKDFAQKRPEIIPVRPEIETTFLSCLNVVPVSDTTDIDHRIISSNLRNFSVEFRSPPTSPSCIRIFTNLNDPLDDSNENVGLETPLDDILRRNEICFDKDISSPLNPKCFLGPEDDKDIASPLNPSKHGMFTHVFDVGERLEKLDVAEMERKCDEIVDLEHSNEISRTGKVSIGEARSENFEFIEAPSSVKKSKHQSDKLLDVKKILLDKSLSGVDENIEPPKIIHASTKSLSRLNPFLEVGKVSSHNPFLSQDLTPFQHELEMGSKTNPFLIDTMNENIIKENIRSMETEQSVNSKDTMEIQMKNAVQNIDNLLSGSFEHPVVQNLCFPIETSSHSTVQDVIRCEEDQKNAVQNIDNLISQANHREQIGDKCSEKSAEINLNTRRLMKAKLLNLNFPDTDLEIQLESQSESKPSEDARDGAQLKNKSEKPNDRSNEQEKIKSDLFDLFGIAEPANKNAKQNNQVLDRIYHGERVKDKAKTKEKIPLSENTSKEITNASSNITGNLENTSNKEAGREVTIKVKNNFQSSSNKRPEFTPETLKVNRTSKDHPQESPSKSLHSSNSKSWPSLQRLEDDVISPPNRSSSVDTIVSTRFRHFIVTKVDDIASSTTSTSETSPSFSDESTEFIWTNPLSPSEDVIEQNSDSDEEFVPSSWNSKAKPVKSLLKTNKPESNEPKKNVSFKTQHYHCVYEYPREPSEYKPYQRPSWDFAPSQPSHYSQPSDFGANYSHPLDMVKFSEDGEFFIRSSMKPLQRPASEFFAGDPYNFFFQPPGEDQNNSSGLDFNEEESVTSFCSTEDTETTPASSNSTIGELCHTKQKLKLDLISPLTQTLSPGSNNKSEFIFPPPKQEFNFLKSTMDLGFLKTNADNFKSDSFDYDTSWDPEQKGSSDEDFEDMTTFTTKSYSVNLTDGELVKSPGSKQFRVTVVNSSSVSENGSPGIGKTNENGSKGSPLYGSEMDSNETKVSPSLSDCSTENKSPSTSIGRSSSCKSIPALVDSHSTLRSGVSTNALTSPKAPTAGANSKIPSSLDIFTNISHKIDPETEFEKEDKESRTQSVDNLSEIPKHEIQLDEPMKSNSIIPNMNGIDTDNSHADNEDKFLVPSMSNESRNDSHLDSTLSVNGDVDGSMTNIYTTSNSKKDFIGTKEGVLNKFNNVTDSLELQRHCVKFN